MSADHSTRDTLATRPSADWRSAAIVRRWRIPVLALALVLGLGLVVSLGRALWPRPAAAGPSAPLAPDFTLPLASNRVSWLGHTAPLSLRALRGHPVLLNFYNASCGPCLDELPVLRQAMRRYQHQGLIVVGVATFGDTPDVARRLSRAAHLPYPVVMDAQAVAWQYGVASLPTSVFVDARGRVAGQYIGPLSGQIVRAGLAQLGVLSCAHCAALEPPSISAAPPSGTGFSADLTYTPPLKAPSFSLRDQQGRVITPRSLRGRVTALTFISALCREQCPLIGLTLSRVRRQLGAEARRFAIVAISVDPEIDTPAATRAFAAESGWRGAEWHYLTARRTILSPLWTAYGMAVPPPSPIFKPGQTIVHQAGVFLLDPRGRVRAYYDTPFFAPRVAATVRALLAAA